MFFSAEKALISSTVLSIFICVISSQAQYTIGFNLLIPAGKDIGCDRAGNIVPDAEDGAGYGRCRRKVQESERRRHAVTIWGVQLAANFLWPLLFFLWQLRLLSLVWLVVLLILVAKMTSEFEKTSVTAARMQIPYLLWLLFAAYLNLGVWILNR